ncbi:MAG: hypothetical protein K2R98_02770 [Gemmataceae bacterium]|nr:hypothetical protein [Gemmataceae bacterium]
MTRLFHHCRTASLMLLALVLCGALPNAAQAAWVGYQNNAGFVVVVQGSSQGPNNQVRRGPPHQINPKEAAWDQVQSGPKTITIFDPRQPNRVFWQGQINVGDKDMFFIITPDGVNPDKSPRVKIVPAAPPAMMPRR